MSTPRRAVVGVGNRYRRDDCAGLEVAELLRGHVPADVQVLTLEGEPTVLLDLLAGSELVVLVDAVASGTEPGAILRFDATHEPVPGNVFGASTHAFGLGETIELARMLGRLHARVLVYGITGEDFTSGEEVSASVTCAIARAADQILRELCGERALDPDDSCDPQGATHA